MVVSDETDKNVVDEDQRLMVNGTGEGVEENHSDNSLESDTNDTEDDPVTEEEELSRLKSLVPSITVKENVTQLDIILEAIRYIDSLKHRLVEKIETGEIVEINNDNQNSGEAVDNCDEER